MSDDHTEYGNAPEVFRVAQKLENSEADHDTDPQNLQLAQLDADFMMHHYGRTWHEHEDRFHPRFGGDPNARPMPAHRDDDDDDADINALYDD